MKTEEIEKALEKDGWTWECQSPCEIRHEDGTFLTGRAANALVQKYIVKIAKHKAATQRVVKKLGRELRKALKEGGWKIKNTPFQLRRGKTVLTGEEAESMVKEYEGMLREEKRKRTYRTTLSDGTVPEGNRAFCVHCDDEGNRDSEGNRSDYKRGKAKHCDGAPNCTCKCHKFPRKSTCLCRKGILKCCCGCGCKCHDRDWVLYDQNRETRERLQKRLQDRREKKRFAQEGVHDWEKKTLEYLMIDPTNINVQFRQFIWAMNKENEIKETGADFMKRMLLSRWGSEYIKNHPPIEVEF